jgi:DNA recombination protein RmuC
MELFLGVAFVLILACFGVIFYLVSQKFKEFKEEQKDNQAMLLLQNQINELTKNVETRLNSTQQTFAEQFGAHNKVMQGVTEKLTEVKEANKQVIKFAEQLQDLEDILKNPKQRGILGEYYLETVLKNVLPPGSYEMQYKFQDGTIVDAAIFVKDKVIPVDSKFSLENYNKVVNERDPLERERLEKLFKQDLKNRIDETSKYIKPSEKTMDFAMMFIPSEGIFYDLLANKVGVANVTARDLIEYAFNDRHVIITSPTSFLAYLQTILQGLRALQIEEKAKEIGEKMIELNKHLLAYESYLQKLGGSIGTVVNTYNTAYKEFKKVDKDVMKITGGKSTVEPEVLEKPMDLGI